MKFYIRPQEVLRYAGGSALIRDSAWNKQVTEAIAMAESLLSPRYCYRFFPISIEKEGVKVIGTSLVLHGNAIKQHLYGCQTCVLMAATVGMEIETKIRRLGSVDITNSLLLDACATEAIESLCDGICCEIEKTLSDGKHLTGRFSPGYGDLPLELQRDFLAVLDAGRQLGLTVTDSSLMTPRKSVTAIMGISETVLEPQLANPCTACPAVERCLFRANDETCKEAK